MLIDRISRGINRLSDIRILVVSLIAFIGMIIFVLPNQSSNLPGDSPDLSIYYSVEDLYRIAETYGEEGRTRYITARMTFDVIWPLVYTTFLASGISWSFTKISFNNSQWMYGNMLPVFALLFDYLENFATVIVMYRYPLITPGVDLAATFFTPIKWFSLGLSFLIFLIGLGKLFWTRAHERV